MAYVKAYAKKMLAVAFSLVFCTMGAAPVHAEEGSAGYNKGFYIKSADDMFSLTIGGRVQFRYAYESLDEGGDEDATLTQFSIPRARLKLSGHAYTKDLSYTFQADWGKGKTSLKDFYVDYKCNDWLHVQPGQFKRPFSRQQITSSGNQQFVDRAGTDKTFKAGRDLGVMLHNNYTKSPEFEYAVGLFNGQGENTVPEHLYPTVVLRLGYNYGGIKGYSETDLEGGPFRFGIGASGLFELDSDGGDDSARRMELDAIAKIEGFSLSAAVYSSTIQDGPSTSDQEADTMAYQAQLGYVFNKMYEPAVRVVLSDPDGEFNTTTEILGCFSIYFKGHNLKWQTDAGAIIHEKASSAADDLTDTVIRSQFQFAF